MHSSAYGNPLPYSSVEVERDALIGRLKVATLIAGQKIPPSEKARWNFIVDELLAHLVEVEARSGSAAME
jgi:hypothetical protein